ncbi:uncharacterized protein si:ch211-151h10.2 isoform X2 [Boleophthalmus pectinirostris]|uniref:uncharacterized protein si:ch211-151h10.2 isoform X2 n=1 Tax=Boleophthalmus pectinirostris TaxID=150288 RepID=UPI000A1C72F9|nr:uncharacterized protein si:ch211-151h10.2 isoform X2 [Boleophthalmus pectinirostris]
MEKEDQETEMSGLSRWSWSQAVTAAQAQIPSWLRVQSAHLPRKNLLRVVAVAVVWSVCQAEAQEYLSISGLLCLCLVWMLLAVGAHALQKHLQNGHIEVFKEEHPQQTHVEVCHFSPRPVQWSRPGPLALVLADSLLLCVLQEPLEGPSVAHIQALLSSLQLVSQTLEEADTHPEEAIEDVDATLTDKVGLIYSYLQQRVLLLSELVEAQSSLEASVTDMQQGLNRLWAQLEEMHTGVTISKKRERECRELPSAQADVKIMLTEVDEYRNKLQSCQSHLKDTIRVLQELTWSHTNVSHTVNSSIESVWPEKLLQSNIEQMWMRTMRTLHSLYVSAQLCPSPPPLDDCAYHGGGSKY